MITRVCRVPAVPGAKVVKALERIGFTVARVNGSHHIMRHPDGRTVAVPVHVGKDMKKGTLSGILGAGSLQGAAVRMSQKS